VKVRLVSALPVQTPRVYDIRTLWGHENVRTPWQNGRVVYEMVLDHFGTDDYFGVSTAISLPVNKSVMAQRLLVRRPPQGPLVVPVALAHLPRAHDVVSHHPCLVGPAQGGEYFGYAAGFVRDQKLVDIAEQDSHPPAPIL
jgi:hypothetical protein